MADHLSDCALHNGPAMVPESCDCGADPSMTPEKYGSEFPLKVDGKFVRLPVKGEEGYGLSQWLQEQDSE